MILADELLKLLISYEKSMPQNNRTFLSIYCGDSGSSFFLGREAISYANGCFYKAWERCKLDSYIASSNRHATITSFLGMIGLDLHKYPNTSHQEMVSKTKMACEIAKLIGA